VICVPGLCGQYVIRAAPNLPDYVLEDGYVSPLLGQIVLAVVEILAQLGALLLGRADERAELADAVVAVHLESKEYKHLLFSLRIQGRNAPIFKNYS
jgi:hypothetical protein